jgi:hypothetical protein
MENQIHKMQMTVGCNNTGVDKSNNLYYNIIMIRTYMIYAGLTFLGYEYGETEEAVLFRTRGKYGPPSNWNVKEYKAKLIELETV